MIFLSLLVLPAFGQIQLSEEDLNKIQLIVNDTVKQEIEKSEKRMKDYIDTKFFAVNTRIDSLEKRFDTIEKRVSFNTNITMGLIALIVVAVGVPQIISVIQSTKHSDMEQKIEELYKKFETLEQRIVNLL